ncbi:MAG: NfeD family protein [Prevotella sp.]
MIDTFLTWYSTLQGSEHTFWTIALIASAVFVVQMILTIIGIDAHDVADLDFADGDTLDTGGAVSLFSIRSLVNFFVGLGWGGVTFLPVIGQTWIVWLVAIVTGLLFAYIYIWMRRKLRGLERNGAIRYTECVGLAGDVYLRVPASRGGRGKVQLSLNGSVHEFDAVTDGNAIPTGAHVKVVSVEGSLLIVAQM